MIGIARIPLEALAQSATIHEKFSVFAPGTNKTIGEINVKVSAIDIDRIHSESVVDKTVHDLQYNKEWEDDVIMRVARKLSTLPCDTDLLFGIFTHGQKNCTKEDFAYCCLNKLNLRKEIAPREMDLFLQGNQVLRESALIERDDFVAVFQNAIV